MEVFHPKALMSNDGISDEVREEAQALIEEAARSLAYRYGQLTAMIYDGCSYWVLTGNVPTMQVGLTMDRSAYFADNPQFVLDLRDVEIKPEEKPAA